MNAFRFALAALVLGASATSRAQAPVPSVAVTPSPGGGVPDSAHPPLTSRSLEVLPGSVLPSQRIIAYYGTPLSKRMGILGEIPPDVMLARLDSTAREWEKADSTTPVKRALHMIVTVAQAAPGRDGMYRGAHRRPGDRDGGPMGGGTRLPAVPRHPAGPEHDRGRDPAASTLASEAVCPPWPRS